MNRFTASPARLKNGSWGARIAAAKSTVKSGDRLRITTRAGKSWTAVVDRVIWGNSDVTLASTIRTSPQADAELADAIGRRPKVYGEAAYDSRADYLRARIELNESMIRLEQTSARNSQVFADHGGTPRNLDRPAIQRWIDEIEADRAELEQL